MVKFVCEVVDEWMVKDLSWLCYVVGVFGLINCICFILLDVNDLGFCNVIFDGFVEVYFELMCVLIKGGSDLIFIEIIFDIFNVKVCVFVVDSVFEELGISLFVMIFGMIIDVFGWILLG